MGPATIHVVDVVKRLHACVGLAVRVADRRDSVRHRDAVRTRVRAEVRVERPVLLQNDDDVLYLVDTRRDEVTTSRSTWHVRDGQFTCNGFTALTVI